MKQSSGLHLALVSLLFFYTQFMQGQEKKSYQVRTVVFYNLENLFDTENDSLTFDDSRTPGGRDHWNSSRYHNKVESIGTVWSMLEKQLGSPGGPDIIGLCEVENRQVVEDIANFPPLQKARYGIIHFDSPDERGIDVALMYKQAAFQPLAFESRRLLLHHKDGRRDYTRDVLVVSGLLDGEEFHFLVNHWPSRSGGQLRSSGFREAAAELNMAILDSIRMAYSNPKIVVMGDLNDNPTDDSIKYVLKSRGDTAGLIFGELYNPMEKLYLRGAGSLAYRDQWSLFDQFLLSPALIFAGEGTYRYWKAGIFNPPELTVKSGRYKGYPRRTYSGGSYTRGYSDHFPVYLRLVREYPY